VAFQPREYGSAESYKGLASSESVHTQQTEKDIEELWP
jgi:hypothetical protein